MVSWNTIQSLIKMRRLAWEGSMVCISVSQQSSSWALRRRRFVMAWHNLSKIKRTLMWCYNIVCWNCSFNEKNLVINYQTYNVLMYIHDLTYSSSMFHWDCWRHQQYLFVCLLEKLFFHATWFFLPRFSSTHYFFLLSISNIANDYLFPVVNKLYIYPSVVHYILVKDFELNANIGQVDTWMLRFSLDP